MSQFPTNPSGESPGPAGNGQLVMIGFGLAIAAVVLVNIYVEMRVSAADEDTITLFRFTGEVEAGKTISMKNIETFDIPESMADSFGKDAIRETSPGSGRPVDGLDYALNSSVVQGEVLRSSLFIETGRRTSRNDPAIGQRQIALTIDSEEQPANLVPGDRIDLLGTVRRSRSSSVETIMEYVKVASVGDRRSDTGDGTRTSRYGKITINVTPEQSKLLYAIKDRLIDEKFIVSLRARNDTATPDTGEEAIVNPKVLQMLGLD